MQGGWIVVWNRTLRFDPRFGRAARSAPIEQGIEGLRLRWMDPGYEASPSDTATAKTVASWTAIVASAPFQRRRPSPDRSALLFNVNCYYVLSDGDYANNPAYLGVIDGERLVVLMEDPATFDACFETQLAWPDHSARLLGTAFSWMPSTAVAAAIDRVSRVRRAGFAAMRLFTKDEVRAGKVEKSHWRNHTHTLGKDPSDAIELRPDRDDRAVLARWLG